MANDQLLNAGIRNDQSVRLFQQGSDGDSLPESPMSSGHDGKYAYMLTLNGEILNCFKKIISIVS